MRLTRSQHSSAMGFNMTAMIDIVFLLIIFFMAVSQITKNQERQVSLPSVEAGGEKLESNFIVNIDRDQKMRIGGSIVSMDALVQRIEGQMKRQGVRPDQIAVRIRLDYRQDSFQYNKLLIRLSRLGVTDIQLSEVQRKQ